MGPYRSEHFKRYFSQEVALLLVMILLISKYDSVPNILEMDKSEAEWNLGLGASRNM